MLNAEGPMPNAAPVSGLLSIGHWALSIERIYFTATVPFIVA